MIEIINYCNQQANKNFSCDYMYAVLPPCILGLGSNDAIKKKINIAINKAYIYKL